MSCLYSSPEVTSLEVESPEVESLLSLPSSLRPIRYASGEPNHRAVQFQTDFPYVAVNKDAFPNSASGCRRRHQLFCLPKQAQVSRVSFQAQYQAFVRFAVGSSAALSAIALNLTCVLEPFTRGGLSL
jgi:hypothetical protein